MHVALLSIVEPGSDVRSDAGGVPRGLLRVGGRSIVQHQLGVATALGCDRVICLAEGVPGGLIALQHAAERAGIDFQVAANGRALARLIQPDDDILVLSDGLVVVPEDAAEVLGKGAAIAVQPIEAGLAAGYERIDINTAGAGLLRIPGRLAGDLGELPTDWNPVSALLRLAVQAGISQKTVPPTLPDQAHWALVRNEADAQALEPRWVAMHVGTDRSASPGIALCGWLVSRMGASLLDAGTRPAMVLAAAALLTVFAMGAAWLGIPTGGFALLGIAWSVARMGEMLERIERETLRHGTSAMGSDTLFAWLLDAAFTLGAIWRAAEGSELGGTKYATIFVALTFMGTLRLTAHLFRPRRWGRWLDDRLTIGIALAAVSLSNKFDLALMGATLLLILLALVLYDSDKVRPADTSEQGADG